LEDIQEANTLLKDILIRKSDELTGATRNYFEKLKTWLQETKNETFTNTEAMRRLRMKETTIRRYHRELTTIGLLHYGQIKGEKTHYYQIVNYADYQILKDKIATVLDKKLKSLENATIRHRSATKKMADQTTRKSKS
jgi:transcription initiation factor IIE alpha subunit